jgi:hypothetical protein
MARAPFEQDLPDELHAIAARLVDETVEISELRLDELKRRALTQAAARQRTSSSLRSKLVAFLTALVVLGASGGAVAISHLDRHPNTRGGAADAQYRPGKGCGNKHHNHQRQNQCKKHKHKHKRGAKGAHRHRAARFTG